MDVKNNFIIQQLKIMLKDYQPPKGVPKSCKKMKEETLATLSSKKKGSKGNGQAFDFQAKQAEKSHNFEEEKNKPISLFEEFIVIGASEDLLKDEFSNFNGLQSTLKIVPETIFSYKGTSNSKEITGLSNYLFPFGFKASLLDETEEQQIINKYPYFFLILASFCRTI